MILPDVADQVLLYLVGSGIKTHYYAAAMLWPRHKMVRDIKRGFSSSEHLKCYDSVGLQSIARDILRVFKNTQLYLEVCLLMMCMTTHTDFYEWMLAEFFSIKTVSEMIRYGFPLGMISRGYNVIEYIRCHRENRVLIEWLVAHDEYFGSQSGLDDPVTPESLLEARNSAKWRNQSRGEIPKELTESGIDRHEFEMNLIRWYSESGEPVSKKDIGLALRCFLRGFIQWSFTKHVVDTHNNGAKMLIVQFGDMEATMLAIRAGNIPVEGCLSYLTVESTNTYLYPLWAYKLDILLDYILEEQLVIQQEPLNLCYSISPRIRSHVHVMHRFNDPKYPRFVGSLVKPRIELIR